MGKIYYNIVIDLLHYPTFRLDIMLEFHRVHDWSSQTNRIHGRHIVCNWNKRHLFGVEFQMKNVLIEGVILGWVWIDNTGFMCLGLLQNISFQAQVPAVGPAPNQKPWKIQLLFSVWHDAVTSDSFWLNQHKLPQRKPHKIVCEYLYPTFKHFSNHIIFVSF